MFGEFFRNLHNERCLGRLVQKRNSYLYIQVYRLIRRCKCMKNKHPQIQVGDKYGRWEVIDKAEFDAKRRLWHCRCECGTKRLIMDSQLKNGESQSCGCLRRDKCRNLNYSHGHTSSDQCANIHSCTRTYSTWSAMKTRCNNPKHKRFHYYGGRGITYCDKWESFEGFLADMGERPQGKSLDRIDVNGCYCKDNCRWATDIEQANNKRLSLAAALNHIRTLEQQLGVRRYVNLKTPM